MSHKIVYGKWIFPADKIRDGNLYLATSLLASSLEVSSLNATVECDDPSILDFQRNAELLYYASPDRPMVFRVQGITRVGPALYELFSTSTLGLLTEGQHMGGTYTGQTAGEVIASICGTVPFIVKTNLTEVKLYGWLPIAPPRDNLAQVLFAIGAALKTDLDGVLRIEGLWDGISGQVPADNMYIDASADYSAKVTQVIVTEHQYVPWTEEKQLFEGTAQQGDIITFDDPMHSLTAEGFTILDSGANWAKVSAGSGVLSGKTYLHNTRQISKDVWPAQEPNVKTVKDATLVSLVNSQACADRLAAYYKCRERIDAPVVYQGEMPGDRLAVYHPFDKTGVDACLESTDITLSNTLKAQEKSLVGFVPEQAEEAEIYDRQELISSAREWVVPEGVSHVRVVLIGGGSGGNAGSDGAPGTSGTSVTAGATSIGTRYGNAGRGGKGGAGGPGGDGGKILVLDLDVFESEVLRFSIGEGGVGGASNGDIGSPGTSTTLSYNEDVFSSDDGASSLSGYTDVVTGKTYAAKGVTGLSGGSGGAGKTSGSAGGSGGDVGPSTGGTPGGSNAYSEGTSRGIGAMLKDTESWGMESYDPYAGAIKGYASYTYSNRTITGVGSAWPSINDVGVDVYKNIKNGTPSLPSSESDRTIWVTQSIDKYWVDGNYFHYRTKRYEQQYQINKIRYLYGTFAGGGGGAAKGSNGNNGTSRSGGNGANAQAPTGATVYGTGGDGGPGGGGGGGGGAGAVEISLVFGAASNISGSYTGRGGARGSGGTGAKGADGAPGCALIYFGFVRVISHGQFLDKNGKRFLDHLFRRFIV